MAVQDIDFFDYVDEQRRPPLLNKHLLLDKQSEQYEKQKRFDLRLSKLLGTTETDEVILHRQMYEECLLEAGKIVSGFRLNPR